MADYYHKLHEEGKRAIQLDRTGNSLFSGGDNDLAACACDLGMGVGLFHELVLDHYIPSFRLTEKYLAALSQGIATSSIIFKSLRNEQPIAMSLKTRMANMVRLAIMTPMARTMYRAGLEGEEQGRRMVKELSKGNL